MTKKRLFTPGPTPIPEIVLQAMAHPIIHHRSPEFEEITSNVNRLLQMLFCTKQPVLSLTSSATGAAEAAITSLFCSGEKGICFDNGKFAARWGAMMNMFGLNVVHCPIEWGKPVTEEIVQKTLEHHQDATCVWFVHSETSTGTFSHPQHITQAIRKFCPEAIVCIDGVTSIGSHECLMDEWDIDVVITGSQKGLMLPPGLSFIALSERAWRKAESNLNRSLYFSLLKARDAWMKNSTPWTPAISLTIGLEKSLQLIENEGLVQVWERHTIMAKAMQAGIKALGLGIFSESPSHAVTAVWVNEHSNLEIIKNTLKRAFGMNVAGGQDSLSMNVFRVAHLGYYDVFDVISFLSGLELAVLQTPLPVQIGSAVSAAQRVIAQEM